MDRYANRQMPDGAKLQTWWEQSQRLHLPVVLGTAFNMAVLGGLNGWWSFIMIRNILRKVAAGKPALDDPAAAKDD